MKKCTAMITKRKETGGEIQREGVKGRRKGTDIGTNRKRRKRTENGATKATMTKGEKSETRKEGGRLGTESTQLRGKEGDRRTEEKVTKIGQRGMKERRENGIEKGSGIKMNMKTRGSTKKDERGMKRDSVRKRERREVRIQELMCLACNEPKITVFQIGCMFIFFRSQRRSQTTQRGEREETQRKRISRKHLQKHQSSLSISEFRYII